MSLRRVHYEHFPRVQPNLREREDEARPLMMPAEIARRKGRKRAAVHAEAERAMENFILGFAGVRLSDRCRDIEDDAPAIEGTIERHTQEHVEWNEAAMEELTRLAVKIVEVA